MEIFIICLRGGTNKFCKPDEWTSSLGTAVGIKVIPEGICPDGYSRVAMLYGLQQGDGLFPEYAELLSLSSSTSNTFYATKNLPLTENPKYNGAWAISATASSSMNVLDYGLTWVTVPESVTSFGGFYLPIDHGSKYVENPYDTGTTWSSYPTAVNYCMSK